MSTDDVRANYNSAGIDIIEMMYWPNYLSIGGDSSVDILAAAAAVNDQSRILDIGCGLGGPALRLAQQYGCHVTGLDLVEVNINGAIERAAERGLELLTKFRVGDATQLPFADASFNLVWGLDAWCHVDDKNRLMSECSRVLEPGGTCAFTDWLIGGDMAAADRAAVLDAAASPNMVSADSYRQLFEANGLALVNYLDISRVFIDQYREVMARLASLEQAITDRFSPKVFGIVVSKNRAILNAFESGGIGGGRFILKKSD